jgi:hypothetical protein
MINVAVSKSTIREMRGIGKASGKPYHLAFQDIHLYTIGPDGKPNEFPDKVELMLEKDQVGNFIVHAPGRYTLHPSSVQVGRDGLIVKPVLVPAVGTARPAA